MQFGRIRKTFLLRQRQNMRDGNFKSESVEFPGEIQRAISTEPGGRCVLEASRISKLAFMSLVSLKEVFETSSDVLWGKSCSCFL